VLFLENILLAIQQHTARHPHTHHNHNTSWGASTLNDSDNETRGLISKYPSRAPSPSGTPRNLMPKGTPRIRGHTPTTSLNTVHSPYLSYDSPPHPRDFAASASSHHVRGKSPSSGPGLVTLRESPSPTPSRHRAHTGDFSYENTPVSAVGNCSGVGIGIAVHSPSMPTREETSTHALREQTSYKSLGVVDGEGRGYGIQQPPRARTVSFG
jgi:hypothetical protein